MMVRLTTEEAVVRVLRNNPDRWLSSYDIARMMPRRVANTPRIISGILRQIRAGEKHGIERKVDPVTCKRYYRYTERENYGREDVRS